MRLKFHVWQRLQSGRVIFVLNNILATRRYLKANSKIEKLAARFVDANMNRLPPNLAKSVNDHRYEIGRAKELLPIWREFTAALDIQSTAKKSPPMMIQVRDGRSTNRLMSHFPIETVIANITKYQLGRPAVSFYGEPEKHIPVVAVEVGSHESKKSFALAVTCVKLFLATAGVVGDAPVQTREVRRRIFRVGGSVIFPDDNWRLVKVFRMFERIRKGQVLAVGGAGKMFRAPFTGVTLFGQPRRRPVKIGDEVLFLARPQ
jgi:hypothetical protein